MHEATQLVLDPLSEQQQEAIKLMLEGKTYGAVAKSLGIAESTLFRWRQGELFKREFERSLIDLYKETSRLAGYAAYKAYLDLISVLDENKELSYKRLQAIRIILQSHKDILILGDLLRRIADLEGQNNGYLPSEMLD
jgi:hypothetical protein